MSEPVDFKSLNLPIPPSVDTYSDELKREIFEYLSSLNETEKIGYNVAYKLLGDAFNIKRTLGFKEWQSKH